jgi:hypothetical protein
VPSIVRPNLCPTEVSASGSPSTSATSSSPLSASRKNFCRPHKRLYYADSMYGTEFTNKMQNWFAFKSMIKMKTLNIYVPNIY